MAVETTVISMAAMKKASRSPTTVRGRFVGRTGREGGPAPTAGQARTAPGYQSGSAAVFTPGARRTISVAQKPVKPLWNRVKPTKAVTQKKLLETKRGLASRAKPSERRTRPPEMMRLTRGDF